MFLEMENVAHEYQYVEGIALSMPGAVDSDGGIIYGSSAIDYIHGPNIKEDLKHRLNKDVEFENGWDTPTLREDQLLKIVMFIMEMHYMVENLVI